MFENLYIYSTDCRKQRGCLSWKLFMHNFRKCLMESIRNNTLSVQWWVLLRKLEVVELLEKPHTFMKLKGPLRCLCFQAFAGSNSIKHYGACSCVRWLKRTIVSETVSVSYHHDTQAIRKYINARDHTYIFLPLILRETPLHASWNPSYVSFCSFIPVFVYKGRG